MPPSLDAAISLSNPGATTPHHFRPTAAPIDPVTIVTLTVVAAPPIMEFPNTKPNIAPIVVPIPNAINWPVPLLEPFSILLPVEPCPAATFCIVEYLLRDTHDSLRKHGDKVSPT